MLAALLFAPRGALADMQVTNFSVTPTTTAAGAHPDVTVAEGFSYSDGTDSVLNTTLHLPAGLLGNPQATAAKCSEAAFEADTCPDNTRVGSTVVGASILGLLPTNSNGDVYNLVPDASHPAVLGIVVRPSLPGAGKIFLKSPISLRTNGDFGIESPVANQPNSVSGLSLQITSTAITLFGTRPWLSQPFMSNPTSCKAAPSSLDASSHETPGTTLSASSTFTPTACSAEPFAPKVIATMGGARLTTRNAHVPFEATITQALGESSQLSTAVTLPASVSSGVSAVPVLCTVGQLAAAACPDGARIGTATIASPLLPTPVQGPVFTVLHPGALPGVGVEFGGVLPFVLGGNSGIASGRLQNIFGGLPDVPLTSFALAIDGGSHGLLVATRDICTGTPPSVDAAFTAQSGASSALTAPVTLEGCVGKSAPHAKLTARGLAGEHPVLQLTVTKGAAKLRSLSLTLPKSIQVGKVKRGLVAVGATFRIKGKNLTLSRKGKLTVKLPASGASAVVVRLSGGRVHASKALKKKLKRHKSTRLNLSLTTVDVQGRHNALHVKFTGRR
ncbi:MAG TPA: hypothetical protein VGI67_13885 [Thermoleophilaceae bacterium]